MVRGDPYDANDPDLVTRRAVCREHCEAFNAVPWAQTAARQSALEAIVGTLGNGVTVMAPLECDYGENLAIGARTFVNFGLIVLDSASVTIGEDVQIGPRVQLLTPNHPLDAVARATGVELASPVTIEDGAWLAAGVIVCPGVTIGAGTVIGAGSVVTRSMPAGQLCVGNPCRVLRPLPSA
jgi:maltose O-acetyltransferase